MSARDVELTFQTNPRGVGGTSTNWSEQAAAGFRPTLVGSEGLHQCALLWVQKRFQTNPRGVGGANNR